MRILDATARRILDRLPLRVKPSATAGRQGGHRSPVLASGVEFADHRPYVPGDDVRRLDWRVFARNGQLVLRQFEEERDARIVVLLDVSGSMSRGRPPKLEIAKRIAASFAYVGMKRFDRALVLPFTDALGRSARPLTSSADLPELDRFLVGTQADGLTSFEQTARTLATQHPRRGLVVVITDLMSPTGFPEGLRLLGGLGHEVRVVHVRCDEDEKPDVRGELELDDAETGQRVRLLVSKELLAAYAKELATHFEACRAACRRAGGRFVDVPVDLPLEASIQRTFRGDER